MCRNGPLPDTRIIDRPEVLLAQHVEECLGIHIDADRLREFICENWMTMSMLAHRIHENDVRRKFAERRVSTAPDAVPGGL